MYVCVCVVYTFRHTVTLHSEETSALRTPFLDLFIKELSLFKASNVLPMWMVYLSILYMVYSCHLFGSIICL